MAKVIKFNGGLRACYMRKKSSLSCAFGIFVKAGSAYETAKTNGIAHFIEHMLFKGTESRTAFMIADEMEKLGANNNAYTSKTNTVFYVNGLAKYIESFMDILADMLFNSTFTEENVAKEKGVVLEEIKMYEDESDSVCSDLLGSKYFNNGFARPILGTEKTVSSFTPADIREFMDKYYRPENICICYVGPLSEDEFVALAEKYFVTPFANKKYSEPFKKPRIGSRKVNSGYYENVKKPFEQSSIILRFPAFGAEDKRSDAVSTLSYMLGGGMSSRLFQEVREERGLVYDIYSMPATLKGVGYFDIAFASAPEKAETAVKVIRATLDKIRKEGFNDGEFNKVKVQRETGAVLSAESSFDEMRFMGRYFCLTDKAYTFKNLLKTLEKLTLEDIKKSFDEIFDYEKCAVCYVGKPIGKDLREVFLSGENE